MLANSDAIIARYLLNFHRFIELIFRAAVTFGLESANIVGYQIIKVPAGFTLFTPTFNGVAGELDLTTISICDENGADLPLYNEVGIQKMDASGAYLDTYGFCPDVGGWKALYA